MLATGDYGGIVGGGIGARVATGLAGDRLAARVIDLVAETRCVTREEILGLRRSKEVAAARQLAMYLVHTLLGRSYLEVAQLFGRDRTTIAYACARIEDSREDRTAFEAEVTAIEAAVLTGRRGMTHAAA
jgi:chromosomal replication initiation ATPase DnaA